MAAALPFASAAMSVVGGLRQARSARHYDEAAVDTRALAEANARRIELEAEEEHRRLKDAQEKRESTARAYAAASGIALSSGSVGTYLNAMEVEHRAQRDWLRKAARSEADIARYEGGMAGRSLEYQGEQQRWRGFSTMFSGIGKAYGAASDMGWV